MSIWATILIIAIVLGVIWSNIALLKHSAKMDMKNFNQDPIEKARRSLEEKQRAEKDHEN
ncbi:MULTISPECIES: DUF2897 family protein [unclassified Pseudoalteromonas]|uniref:DUF2897 family protein n=1 Tax=unclassified Pseudoalteromonas TaxID=194690 RepID=UPI0006D644CA|nr:MULTISPECIES: DUF2897 family protein [unclassified Pseudoalteromonas]KPV96062.1 hypothetical protein AN214_01871 [Pseudoalteromonas sp. P1-9]MCF6455275.1 DUF2897 family protein [Pseudoalteromonas sp. MMG024]